MLQAVSCCRQQESLKSQSAEVKINKFIHTQLLMVRSRQRTRQDNSVNERRRTSKSHANAKPNVADVWLKICD